MPMVRNRQATAMWRFWIEGKEVYATVRRFGRIMKFSIHHSGQIHTRTGRAAPLVMAPAVPVENGPWMNTLELRFLTSDDAIAPPPEELKKETDRACGIPVPPGHFLHLNVLVVRGIKAPVPLPQIPGTHVLWTATLSTQEPVALVCRYMPHDEENCAKLRYIRHELTPHATYDKPVVEPPYVEIRQMHWGPGGNVVFIVPMGHEGYRAPVA
jgi:hypothetical protein